jgi:uncharacterized protein (DUF1697 family)
LEPREIEVQKKIMTQLTRCMNREDRVPKYIALLRGVNVGQNLLKMDRLRQLCGGLGFVNVVTYVQSGNIVFEADGSASDCGRAIEQCLAGETRLPVTVIVRTPAEMRSIIRGNPFLDDKTIDRSKLHVTFLAGAAAKEGVAKLSAIKAGADQFRAAGKEVYLHCPSGYGTSKLANSAIEKALAVRATTRNWNTVNKLYEMVSGKVDPS